jgi:hypothetical protein
VTDAVATGVVSGQLSLVQKAYPLPHLGLLIGARGDTLPVESVVQLIQSGTVVPASVEEAAQMLTALLPEIADTQRRQAGEAEVIRFVAFLFGWSFEKDRMIGYAFRSPDGCKALPLPDTVQICPPLPSGTDLPASWLGIAEQQREADEKLQADARANLGGWITVYEMMRPEAGFGPAIRARNVGMLSGTTELIQEAGNRWHAALAAYEQGREPTHKTPASVAD